MPCRVSPHESQARQSTPSESYRCGPHRGGQAVDIRTYHHVIIEVLLGYRNTFEETRDPWPWVVRPVVGLYRATPHDVPVRPCARTAKHISHPTSSYFEKVLQIFDRERPFLWEGLQIFNFILDAVRRRPDREQGQPNGPGPNRRCGRYFGVILVGLSSSARTTR